MTDKLAPEDLGAEEPEEAEKPSLEDELMGMTKDDAILKLNARIDTVLSQLDPKLDNLLIKHVPVSEERLNKLWASVRDTIDAFSASLAANQKDRQAQNDKIASLATEVEGLKQQVVILSALTQGGMPVPKE